ncbi:hypothetical protein M33023_00850 [Candidatus Phytoplasma asteris]|uniref:Uncharacterized protein n=1 Tax=Candidatus Phytoplasma asteris TaxID=85620 RepID=A0ABZ2YEF9_9MOLU
MPQTNNKVADLNDLKSQTHIKTFTYILFILLLAIFIITIYFYITKIIN